MSKTMNAKAYAEYAKTFCYAVDYIENGIACHDTWSQRTLAEELRKNEVLIVRVEHRSLWDTDD